MWMIEELEEVERATRIGDIDGGPELWASGVRISNAPSYVDLCDDPVQLIVCESCGQPGCAMEGYVSMRRTGEDEAFLLPAFRPGHDLDINCMAPPYWMVSRGTAIISRGVYEHLRRAVHSAPSWPELLPLRRWEAARLVIWESPLHGRGALTQLSKEVILGEDEVEGRGASEILSNVLKRWGASQDEANLEPKRASDQEIYLFLDIGVGTEWVPMVERGGQIGLQMTPGVVCF